MKEKIKVILGVVGMLVLVLIASFAIKLIQLAVLFVGPWIIIAYLICVVILCMVGVIYIDDKLFDSINKIEKKD